MLYEDDHPLLHPDIFATVALYVGECLGGPDFCAWLSTCKRAQRLSKRVDVMEMTYMLQNAYVWIKTAQIIDQIITPYDLIRRMITHNPVNWIYLQPHQRTFELCKIAVMGRTCTILAIENNTELSDEEQFELWYLAIMRQPHYIIMAEIRWGVNCKLATIEISPMITISDLDDMFFIPLVSPFVESVVENWKKRILNRKWWDNKRIDAMCCAMWGVVAALGGYAGGDDIGKTIRTFIYATCGGFVLQTMSGGN